MTRAKISHLFADLNSCRCASSSFRYMARACDEQGSRSHRCVIQHHNYRPRLTFPGSREVLSSRAIPPRREQRAIARGETAGRVYLQMHALYSGGTSTHPMSPSASCPRRIHLGRENRTPSRFEVSPDTCLHTAHSRGRLIAGPACGSSNHCALEHEQTLQQA